MHLECKYCLSKRPSKKSLIAHEATCPSNPNGYRNVPWNKGQTKDTNDSLNRVSLQMTGKSRPDISASLKMSYETGKSVPHKTKHSSFTKQTLSEIAKSRKFGGYVKGSGRGRKGWYKGYFCDSSWELAYVVFCLDHNIPIARNKEYRSYSYKGKTKRYLPDFIVDGKIVEIKGYKTEEWLCKIQDNNDVIVLYENDIRPYLDYVIEKYGKNFTRLYELEDELDGIPAPP